MLVQDCMIFIMEKNRMWKIQKKETYEIWTSEVCTLKIINLEERCKVFVNYKGYNVVMVMGMYGFEEEIQERNISFDIEGEMGEFNLWCYVVKIRDLKLFCDMIYFFLAENNIDEALNEAYRYSYFD